MDNDDSERACLIPLIRGCHWHASKAAHHLFCKMWFRIVATVVFASTVIVFVVLGTQMQSNHNKEAGVLFIKVSSDPRKS